MLMPCLPDDMVLWYKRARLHYFLLVSVENVVFLIVDMAWLGITISNVPICRETQAEIVIPVVIPQPNTGIIRARLVPK